MDSISLAIRRLATVLWLVFSMPILYLALHVLAYDTGPEDFDYRLRFCIVAVPSVVGAWVAIQIMIREHEPLWPPYVSLMQWLCLAIPALLLAALLCFSAGLWAVALAVVLATAGVFAVLYFAQYGHWLIAIVLVTVASLVNVAVVLITTLTAFGFLKNAQQTAGPIDDPTGMFAIVFVANLFANALWYAVRVPRGQRRDD